MSVKSDKCTELLKSEHQMHKKEYMIGVSHNNGLISTKGIGRGANTIQLIEGLGYKCVFPAKLDDEVLRGLSEDERRKYDIKQDTILCVDTDGELSVQMASEIIEFYRQCERSVRYIGSRSEDGKQELSYLGTGLVSTASKDLVDILRGIGFKAELTTDGKEGIVVEAGEQREGTRDVHKNVFVSAYEELSPEERNSTLYALMEVGKEIETEQR